MAKAFTTLTGVAAPLLEDDIDTDIIFPARFLLIMEKAGLGKYLFNDRRFDADGAEIADFVLNRPQFRSASILIAGDNFGCGSSREHAVWTLEDYGIRCVIAAGFGEIFAANCIRSGLLPARVTRAEAERLAAAAAAGPITVSLETRTITTADGATVSFDIDPSSREALLHGWDDIDQILAQDGAAIEDYERKRAKDTPWLYEDL
ncbi:MAG TPA: 3-isopropylmalate dehydratase small subunit [Sphingomonadales bacterium]